MPAPSPHGSRRAVLSHRALQTASLPQLTTAIPRREVGLVDPALHDRTRFPLRAVAACQPLPHVNGPTVSEYYGLIRLPMGLRLPYHFSFRVRLPAPGPIVGNPMYRPSAGTHRVSQVPDASLHTCHALRGPRQTLGQLTKTLSLCWLLVPLLHRRLHHPRYRGCIKTLGSVGDPAFSSGAVSLAAYVVPWVRFSCLVRSCDLLHNCNPRCGWLVRPYPTGTSTLQENAKLAWRSGRMRARAITNKSIIHVSRKPPSHPGRSDFPSPVGGNGLSLEALPTQPEA